MISKRLVGSLTAIGGVVGVAWWSRRTSERVASDVAVAGTRGARTAELAKIGSKAGASYAAMSARSAFASDEKKIELRERFELETAEQVAEVLGNMKGAVMKLGQMASYLDQGLPEPVREALANLQSDAPPMSRALAARVVATELGAPPEEIFAVWNPDPIAAASIGQVHRATTHEGIDVAVKIQYPGVDDAIRTDLDSSDLLFGVMAFVFPGMDPKPIVAELRERLTEELDYRNEAANQTRFADAYEGHPTIHVPRVIEKYSTGRVLTSEFVVGAPFSEVITWSQEERNLAAETLYRFAFGGIYRLGMFNGDPHPGNYLFGPGGRITFLDFGLCKIFTPDEVTIFERLIRFMVYEQDMMAFARYSQEIGVLNDASKFSPEAIFAYFSHFYEFVLEDEEMAMTPEYASESVRRYFDLSGPHADIMKSANVPSSMVIVQRINLGLFALFADLRAVGNWRRLAEEIWPFIGAPPSTPMGAAIAEWDAATNSPDDATPSAAVG